MGVMIGLSYVDVDLLVPALTLDKAGGKVSRYRRQVCTTRDVLCTREVRGNQEPSPSPAVSEIGNLWSSSELRMASISSYTSPSCKSGS
jgi:hypothetical protein